MNIPSLARCVIESQVEDVPTTASSIEIDRKSHLLECIGSNKMHDDRCVTSLELHGLGYVVLVYRDYGVCSSAITPRLLQGTFVSCDQARP